MKEFFITLFSMTIAGLAFLVYYRPPAAKRVIEIFTGVLIVCYFLFSIYKAGVLYGLTTGNRAAIAAMPKLVTDGDMPAYNPYDSVSEAKRKKLYAATAQAVHDYKIMLSVWDKISKSANALIKEDVKEINLVRNFFMLGLVILLVLYYTGDIINKFGKPINYPKKN